RNILFLFFFFFYSLLLGQGNALRFSDSLRISLITGSPGTDLYAQFGHSVIRVVDYKYGTDLSFNYGTFDFDTPNFYWKFLRGKLNYTLSVSRTKAMIAHYTRDKRQLLEQEILLSQREEEAVAAFLKENYLPQNRLYLYDFFYDNCATRIRDILEKEVKEFEYTAASEIESYTFRQMLDLYIGKGSWTDFGMDLILGYPTDQLTDVRDQMFLPEYLAQNLKQHARKEGKILLGDPKPLNQVAVVAQKLNVLTSPMTVMSLIFIVGALLTFFANEKVKIWFDRLLFPILGLAGCLMLFLWFGTDHWTTTKNLNVIWANPLFLLFPFLKQRKWLAYLGMIALIVILLGWFILPQEFHLAFLPILLLIGVRSGDRLDWLKFRK
ncbi:MAG: DUF4105 domain-containing protein, partial [Bacteroidota bacterium]